VQNYRFSVRNGGFKQAGPGDFFPAIERISPPQVAHFLGLNVQKFNSRTAFLVEVSGHKLESSQTRVFVWFSSLILPVYKMLFMNRLEFSCFADFFKGFF
jgi:hypothetical protein